MENEIQVGRIARLLQKLLNMKGLNPTPQLSGDLMASIILEMDRVEYGFLSGEAYFSSMATSAAVAAQFSIIGLFNGQATGALVVVESVILDNTSAAALTYAFSIGATTALAASHVPSTDMRFLGKNSTAQFGGTSEGARTGTLINQVTVPANSTLIVPVKVILPPNSSPTPVNGSPNLYIEGGTVNTSITVGMTWRERPLEASEGPVPGA